MYSNDLIQLAASKNKLHELFAEMMKEKEQRPITIHNPSGESISLMPTDEIIPYIKKNEVFVTNATYDKDMVAYRVIDSDGNTLVLVSRDGNEINDLCQREYLQEFYSEQLATVYNYIKDCDTICIPAA